MTQLSGTLSRCAGDMVGFLVMFFIIFGAFVQLGSLLFGTQIFDYSSLYNTIFALIRNGSIKTSLNDILISRY